MEASFLTEQENPGIEWVRPPMMERQQEARVPPLGLVSEKRRTYARIFYGVDFVSISSDEMRDLAPLADRPLIDREGATLSKMAAAHAQREKFPHVRKKFPPHTLIL
ncbi:hypothetical protein J6590_101115 [Homalodisca vitripennis]|nr:hypothetical protein J6590_101115 [Homalodisca vitripennis]